MNIPCDALRQNAKLWELYALKGEYGPEISGKVYDTTRGDALEPSVSRLLIQKGLRPEYPDGKKFAVCLTHDVDDIYPPLSHSLYSIAQNVKSANARGLTEWLVWRYKGKQFSPYWNFKELMEMEERYGARSSFYFMATDRDILRFRYHIEDLGSELGTIADQGWEVGLHGGYYAFDDPEEIGREKKRLEKVLGRAVVGYRNHYLMFKVPDTWEYLARAGFKYDTTIGYNNMVGFRNGMCHPYRPFNLTKNTEIDMVEIPIAIMDNALFKYARSYDGALEASKRLIDTIERLNGVATILWHNNSLVSSTHRAGWAKVYGKLLEYCKGKNAWMTSGEDIYHHAIKHGL